MPGIDLLVRRSCFLSRRQCVRPRFTAPLPWWRECEILLQVERFCQWRGFQTDDGILVDMEDSQVGINAPELGRK